MIDWPGIKKAADETEEKPWNPVGGFDINGDTPEGSPIDHEKAFGRAMKYGLGAGGLTWFVHWLLTRKKKDRIKAAKNRLAWALGIGGAAAAYGYGNSAFEDSLKGTHFNYRSYKPKGKGDYNIVVAGAGSGAHDPYYKKNYDKVFGGSNYVMFNPNDEEAMVDFVDSLPKGSRVRIYGHSRGGKPAWDLAEYAGATGKTVDQLNTVDIVGEPWNSYVPKNVKTWNNWLLKRRPFMNSNKLDMVKDLVSGGSLDGDMVARMGGITGGLPGADNKFITNPDWMSHGGSIFGVIRGLAEKKENK